LAWARNGTVTAVSQSLTGLTGFQFNQILNHVIDNGSAIDLDFTIDNITTDTYAYRESSNGVEATATEQTEITLDDTSAATERFTMMYGLNIAGEEKLFISTTADANTAGPGTAPNRVELTGKQTGTSAAWTRIDIVETGAGAFTDASNLTALGTD